jgi:hypothetical protein
MPGSDELPFGDLPLDAEADLAGDAAPDQAPDHLDALDEAEADGALDDEPVEDADAEVRAAAEADRVEAAVDPEAVPEPVAKVVRSFQASAGIQGRQFAEQCDTLLTHLGYELHGRRVLAEVGVEIDQEAVGPNGTLVWFEYKGSVQGHRPGLRRTDTMKKAIANGALLHSLPEPAPYVVITSHLPEAGSGAAMLDAATRLKYFADVVCLYDTSATGRLARW